MGWDQDVPGVGLGQWYSLWVAGGYKFTDRLDAAVRLEWFDDVNGTRTGFATCYAEVTVAATWRPRPWVAVRPEVRGDLAGRDAFGPVSNLSQTSCQLTAALDWVIQF